MYKEIVGRLLNLTKESQIEINYEVSKKIFRLTIPVYSLLEIPNSVKNYIDSRKAVVFKPHVTFYERDEKRVTLVQEIPFALDFQETLRKRVDLFLDMAQKCKRMLHEIAVEEKYHGAFTD
jgi:hypothetical protein